MRAINTGAKRSAFDVLVSTRSSQAARMSLHPGKASDDEPTNEHPRSEQWLFVIDGSGEATVGRTLSSTRKVKLKPNSLLLIEKGELHRIKNTGRKVLSTITFYVPPAYDEEGEVLKSARS